MNTILTSFDFADKRQATSIQSQPTGSAKLHPVNFRRAMRLIWGLLLILFIECDDPVGIAVLWPVETKLGQADLIVD
jgi:hypothetical protein